MSQLPAFRAIQAELDLDEVYVMGTNCVDNSPTPEAAEQFIREGVQIPENEQVLGYEFMQDFKVHVKTETSYITKPYFSLPGTIADPSIATSCKACFDYTNALADVVVGYMAAPLDANNFRMDQSFQTLTVRNAKGATMVKIAQEANRLEIGEVASGRGSHEILASSTVDNDSIVLGMIGGDIPEQGLPTWIGELMALAMTNLIAPKGVSFGRYSIDYHLLRNYLHVLHEWGEDRANKTMPQFARDIVNYYKQNDAGFRSLVSKVALQEEK